MNICKAKKKTKSIRRERNLLFVYALAVTGAFFVSVSNNGTVEASTPGYIQLADQAPEEFSQMDLSEIDDDLRDEAVLAQTDDQEDPSVVESDDSQELDLSQNEPVSEPEPEPEAEPEPAVRTEAVTIQKGDSFIHILTQKGLTYAQATDIYTTLKKVYDARLLKVGQVVNMTTEPDSTDPKQIVISKIMIEPSSGTRYIVERGENAKYKSFKEQDKLATEVKTISGTIRGSVISAMSAAGVPSNISGSFIRIFTYSVDFRRDVKAGDKFEVRYERQLAPNGKVVKTGEIVYAALYLGRKKTELYRFKDKNGHVDYYNEQGLALKRNLDRKPMEFQRARISSRFGRRFHPILKEYRKHDGVDYAAPSGSKVYASGNGVITAAKWYGGYGNYISIRHNSEYSTGYGHLKGFAKGIRPGVRVKQGQLIAYVGNTGRSTGPHLHFEIEQKGRKVDPLTVKAAAGENLAGESLRAFKKTVAQIKAGTPTATEVASTEKRSGRL